MKKTLSYLSIPAVALSAMFLFESTTHANHEKTIQECAESYNTRKDTGMTPQGQPVTDEENRMLFEQCRERINSQRKGNGKGNN